MDLSVILLACVSSVFAALQDNFFNMESIPEAESDVPPKKYRPEYHITALEGWLSYPTGFTKYRGRYHLFYQFQLSNAITHMLWGHVVSETLIEWYQYPTAVVPTDWYDQQACLGGSAVRYKNRLTIFYTGYFATKETQNMAMSGNGMIFKKFSSNPILRAPANITSEFRDPKVWRHKKTWYMLVATTSTDYKGQLVLYTSHNIVHWKYHGVVVKAFGEMGYLWENPDLIKVNGQHVLILSVRGLESQKYIFQNVHQSGYIVTTFNYTSNAFEDMEISRVEFNQLDYGYDFYAAKTVTSYDGRKLLIAWLGTPQKHFSEPYGLSSMLTLIREIKFNHLGTLLINPIEELLEQRIELLDKAWYWPGESFEAETEYFELLVRSDSLVTDVGLVFSWGTGKFTIKYSAAFSHISIDRGGEDGLRRASWSPTNTVNLRIFVDYSSIEIFCGEGEIVFSSRIYPSSTMHINVTGQSPVYILQYKLGSFKMSELNERI